MEHRRSWLGDKYAGKPQPKQVADKTLVLRVENEYFSAGAVWKRRSNVWACTEAAQIISWMVGMSRYDAKRELAMRGCKWEWLEG